LYKLQHQNKFNIYWRKTITSCMEKNMDSFTNIEIIKKGFEFGHTARLIEKRAAEGDLDCKRYLEYANKLAEDAGMLTPPASGDPNAAMMAAPAPAPAIQCPSCGAQIVPNPDGTCPSCGFNLNTLGSQAPSPEALVPLANEIKTAALNDANFMAQLVQHYGNKI
jgi:hypothetical protein